MSRCFIFSDVVFGLAILFLMAPIVSQAQDTTIVSAASSGEAWRIREMDQ
jgi:hypothetical protein